MKKLALIALLAFVGATGIACDSSPPCDWPTERIYEYVADNADNPRAVLDYADKCEDQWRQEGRGFLVD